MATAPQTGMDKAELKKLLVRSKNEPVNCGIGIGKEQQAMILLHKTKQPRAILQELEKDSPGLKNPCFGTAFVDIDEDPKLVILTVNKAAGGLARKLKKSLKGTGFSKVQIRLEDGTIADAVGEEDDEEEGTTGAPPAASVAEAGKVPEPPPRPPVDIAALRTELAALIPQIPGAAGSDAARLDTLKKLAGAANASIKSNDAAAAETALLDLKKVIGASSTLAPPSASAPPPTAEQKPGAAPTDAGTLQKSRLIWESARKKVTTEIGSFKLAVRKEFAGDPQETSAVNTLGQLDEILARLDGRLTDTLDGMLTETDATKRAKLHGDAKGLIDEYFAYTQSNPLVQKLDGDTPFGMKLSIGATMTATLKALQTSLR